MYKVYKGSVTVAAAGSFGYSDIDPADRDGYAHQIISAAFLFEEQGTTAEDFIGGLSIKVPVRTTFTDSEIFDYDILGAGIGPYRGDVLDWPGIGGGERLWVVQDPLFSDTMRVVCGTRDGVADANGIIMHYRLEIEDRKLTDSLRELMNRRCYS